MQERKHNVPTLGRERASTSSIGVPLKGFRFCSRDKRCGGLIEGKAMVFALLDECSLVTGALGHIDIYSLDYMPSQ